MRPYHYVMKSLEKGLTEIFMTTYEVLFAFLRNEIAGAPLPDMRDVVIDEVALLRLASKHSLSHLLIGPIDRNGIVISDDFRKKLVKKRKIAVTRDVRMTSLSESVKSVFCEKNIDYALLKGLVVRNLYPESWMRSNCDMDVLIREEDLDKAMKSLLEFGFTTEGETNYHDVALVYDDTKLELHFSVKEDDERLDKVLGRVWEYLESVGDNEFKAKKEFFVFHLTAHAAYHFMHGGCGIRPAIDLFLLRKKWDLDRDKLDGLLKESGLTNFYNALKRLSDIWFDGATHDKLTLKMQKYILNGGAFGSKANAVSAQIAGSGNSKLRYLFKLTFLPYENMCVIYPSLKKRKILLPLYYVYRIITKTFSKNGSSARKHVEIVKKTEKKRVKIDKSMFNELGLGK